MADDWGCAPDQDLFSSSVCTSSGNSLNDIVERLSAPVPKSKIPPELQAFPLSTSKAENVERIPDVIKNIARSAPKILKKKNNRPADALCVKKVSFEVQKMVFNEVLVGDEKLAARTRAAIQLGAAPAKGKKLNYKILKQERATLKAQMKAEKAEPKVTKYKQKKAPKKKVKRRNFDVA